MKGDRLHVDGNVLLTLNLFLEENCRTVSQVPRPMVRFLTFGFLIALCVCGAGAQIKSYPDKETANILRIEKNTLDPKIKIESVTGFPDKTTLVVNSDKTFKAFVLCVPKQADTCSSRVFFTNAATGESFTITGEPSEAEVMRPVSELKWLDNQRLSYERWMNPHFGRRYIVNVKLRKQTAAFVLSDTR